VIATPPLQYSEFSSSNSLNIFKVFIYRVNNQRVMTTKPLKHVFLGHSVWPKIQQTVKGLVICFYLSWAGSILQFRQNIIKVGSKKFLNSTTFSNENFKICFQDFLTSQQCAWWGSGLMHKKVTIHKSKGTIDKSSQSCISYCKVANVNASLYLGNPLFPKRSHKHTPSETIWKSQHVLVNEMC